MLVPLYETLGVDASTFIINQTDLKIVVCDTINKVRTLVAQHGDCPSLRTLVVMESEVSAADVAAAKKAGIELLTLDELERRGRAIADRPSLQQPKSNDLATICYTSGTTGLHPKGLGVELSILYQLIQLEGVMLTHGNIVANICTLDFFTDYVELDSSVSVGCVCAYNPIFTLIQLQDVMMSFLPLAHMFERIVQAAVFAVGGSVGFFRGKF